MRACLLCLCLLACNCARAYPDSAFYSAQATFHELVGPHPGSDWIADPLIFSPVRFEGVSPYAPTGWHLGGLPDIGPIEGMTFSSLEVTDLLLSSEYTVDITGAHPDLLSCAVQPGLNCGFWDNAPRWLMLDGSMSGTYSLDVRYVSGLEQLRTVAEPRLLSVLSLLAVLCFAMLRRSP